METTLQHFGAAPLLDFWRAGGSTRSSIDQKDDQVKKCDVATCTPRSLRSQKVITAMRCAFL